MEKIGPYILGEKVCETRNSIIYRGYKDDEPQTFILKQIKTKNPTPSDIARFKQEYDLIKGVELKGIVQTFDVIHHGNQFTLVLEDFDGVSVKSILDQQRRFSLKTFLQISAVLSEALGRLHMKGIVHRDLTPQNILIDETTERVKITDFGISAILTGANDEVYNPDFIVGTLAYMSPEQTGRTNRIVDYRTDLYSLGVTLYEMITGGLPFQSYDPMELIHSHIAVMPKPPVWLDSGIPAVVSDIIMKLLAKNPEERYQNGLGLLYDIEECLKRLDAENRIDEFPLASKDISIKFNIPQILVGREEETNVLLKAFERSTRGTAEMMFVLGQPGIGKSALINEIRRPIVEKKGYFIFGKYDQFRKDVPYSAIIHAFQIFIRQLLSESDDRIGALREKLAAALSSNGKVITDVIPEMEYIIGKQPDVEFLGLEESQNRFNNVFRHFIHVFTTADHPMTLFLDDLQWADLASLNLIKIVMTGPAAQCLLLIGAYRDNEISPHHPLAVMLDEIQKIGKEINSISLAPLNIANVNKIIVNVLRCKEEESARLAQLVHKKTGGNPFFVNQFLKNLYDRKVIELDSRTGWKWDVDEIQKMRFTDNVVEFMAGRILNLPVKTWDVLKVCACIGNRFDLETLSIVLGRTLDHVLADITAAIGEDLVSFRGNYYEFHHDHIQEAAYSIIPDHERTRLHYLIGKNVLEKTSGKSLYDKIFYIVDQLNRGVDLITTPSERLYLAELNLKAAQKAKNSTAYASAVAYLKTGGGLLPDLCWKDYYALTYSLHIELMECQYLGRNFEEAERLFQIIIANAASKIDQANAYNIMIVLYANLRSPKDAIELGIKALKLFGINLSIHMGMGPVLISLIRVKIALAGIPPEKIMELPMMVDEERIVISHLMKNMGTSAYYVNTNLWAYIALAGVRESLKYGHSPNSAVGFLALATITQAVYGNYELGYRLGEMALNLNARIDNKKVVGMINHIYAFLISHWKNHARRDIECFAKVYQVSFDAGDFIYAGHSVNAAVDCRLMVGDRLDDIYNDIQKYRELMNIVKEPFIAARYLENLQMIRNLKGLTSDRLSLSGDGYDEREHISRMRRDNNFYGLFFTLMLKIKILYLYGRYEEALRVAAELYRHIKVPVGTLLVSEYYFYHSLIMTALLGQGEKKRALKFKAMLRRNQRKMRRWAGLCPENFRHKYDLVAAEIQAVKGRWREAQSLYHAAIEGAGKNEYLHEEAMACERLALFHLDCGARDEAGMFIQRAYQRYDSWGAQAKLNDLEEKYAPLVAEYKRRAAGDLTAMDMSGEATGSSRLDLSTVMQVSQVISSEMMLDRLLQKIMHMSMANAGAQRGYLILESNGDLRIEASEDVDTGDVQVMQSMTLQDCAGLCPAIINYVHRSGKDVILGDAAQEGPFANDPYIMRTRCKSILCVPIKSKGTLSGILYMENNLTPNAFTPERIEPLRIVSSQAAISIENARLFELATTDGLTKLYARRYFQLLLDQEFLRSRRYNNHFSLIMMDIDNFKSFNDSYGHQLGDDVLKNVARAVKKISRGHDIAARYGGEEFVMILPETDARQAMVVAEKIRATVAEIELHHGHQKLHVTMSLGVSAFPTHAQEKEALIRSADAALYSSKHRGKNCVRLFDGSQP